MKKILLSILALAVLAGCVSAVRVVSLKQPFDKDKADRLLRPGNNTIRVNAFLRQEGGGVVTCAGEDVRLVPVTELADEHITVRYGSPLGGYVSFFQAAYVRIINEDPEYTGKQRTATCSSDGRVTFDKVANGSFYITTLVSWTVQNVKQGGFLSKRVSVEGGENIEVVLSNK
jgi:hypothetical protein